MKRLHIKKLKEEKGQSVVEFALVLPVLLLILCGILEFSWALYGKLSLENTAREAARAGSVGATVTEATANAQNTIVAIIPDYLNDSLVDTISFSTPSDPGSGNIVVNLQADTEALTPLAGVFGMNEIHLESECVMKMF